MSDKIMNLKELDVAINEAIRRKRISENDALKLKEKIREILLG